MIFKIPPTYHVAPKNEKSDLGTQQHLEQLGVMVIFKIPPTNRVAPKNEKIGSRHVVTFGTTFGVRVRVIFKIPPTNHVTPKNKKLDLGM